MRRILAAWGIFAVACPGVWRQEPSVVRAVGIPRYNRENGGYIEKYQSILSLFD